MVCGVLTDGILREKDAVQIGPFKDGNYRTGRIESIRRNKQPVRFLRPGEAASMALAVDETYVQSIRRVRFFCLCKLSVTKHLIYMQKSHEHLNFCLKSAGFHFN